MEETRSARLLRQIKEICEVAGIKTEEYAKVTKKRLDVLSLTRELNREKTSLGERVYELSRREERGDVLEDVTVQAVLGRILNLENSLTDCEEEISDIRRSASVRASDVRRRPDSEEVGDEAFPEAETTGEEAEEPKEAVPPPTDG